MASVIRHLQTSVWPAGRLPRLPFRLAGVPVGYVRPDFADRLLTMGCHRSDQAVELDDPTALFHLAESLGRAGAYRLRGEQFDVRAVAEGPVLATIDRGAIPSFGLLSEGVHLNGLVQAGGETRLWVGYRSKTKALDPGKLDHLVAGGVPTGMDAWATLHKESAEEASLPESRLRTARYAGHIQYAIDREEGLRRDRLAVFDLDLPPDFLPVPNDGEVERFELWSMDQVLDTLRDSEDFKFNVAIVVIDLLARLGKLDPQESRAMDEFRCRNRNGP